MKKLNSRGPQGAQGEQGIPGPVVPLGDLEDVDIDSESLENDDVLAWDSDGWYNIPRSKFGVGDNYSEFEADGTLVAKGDATLWDDIRIVPGAFSFPGSADPTLQSWQPGGSGTTFKVWTFNPGDYVEFTLQVPHAWKIGSTMYAHVHWTPRDRGTSEENKWVQWKLGYSVADINGVFGASQTINMSDTCDGINHKHQMSTNGSLDMSAISGVSSMLVCKMYRDNQVIEDDWAGTGANGPSLLEFDIHYEIDTIGSRTVSSK